MNEDPLALLRDIHPPPDPGWWPPAPLFGLLAVTVLAVLVGFAWRRFHARRKPPLARRVMQELALAQKDFGRHADARRLARELSGLLRRTALARHGDRAAPVCGQAWADYLMRASPPDCDPALWSYLAVGRYAADAPAPDVAALLGQCRRWLRQVCT